VRQDKYMEAQIKTNTIKNETTVLFVIGLFVGGLTLLTVSMGDFIISSYEKDLAMTTVVYSSTNSARQ